MKSNAGIRAVVLVLAAMSGVSVAWAQQGGVTAADFGSAAASWINWGKVNGSWKAVWYALLTP